MSQPAFEPMEQELLAKGFKTVCGVDEAGRGPLAGPVCAAAVILDPGYIIEGLNDSKKLSEKKREALYGEITAHSLCYSVLMVDEKIIDEINILKATFQAMTAAVNGLEIRPDMVLIDGNMVPPELGVQAEAVVKGDARVRSIAAASVLAKVTRDRFMLEMDKKYPGYFFAKHKGYGTKLHTDMIKKLGPCEIHRLTFLKNICGQ